MLQVGTEKLYTWLVQLCCLNLRNHKIIIMITILTKTVITIIIIMIKK